MALTLLHTFFSKSNVVVLANFGMMVTKLFREKKERTNLTELIVMVALYFQKKER